MDASLQKLEKRIGYVFHDKALLEQAVSHKSYSKSHNERLEFVGDAVLGYIIGTILYRRYPEVREDGLTLARSELVRGRELAVVASEIRLAECLKLGEGERKSGGRQRASILANAFEALLGAVHEDALKARASTNFAEGIEPCQRLIEQLFDQRIEQLQDRLASGLGNTLKDSKTQLQEYLQARGAALPAYNVAEISGADHNRSYTVECAVQSLDLKCQGTSSSRRDAEKKAAEKMLALLIDEGAAESK